MNKVLADTPISPGEGILHHTEGIDFMPANIELSGLEVSLVNAMSREKILNPSVDLSYLKPDDQKLLLEAMDIAALVSLLRRSSNNLNQYAKRAHETGSIYETDIEDIRLNFERLWDMANQILTRLSTIE